MEALFANDVDPRKGGATPPSWERVALLWSAMASPRRIAFVPMTDQRKKELLAQDRATGAAGEKPVTYERSAVMRAVKSRDTSPERAVRALLRPIAPGYRLHRADLPGKPDIVYAARKLVIFVHGCFWHGHNCTRGARMPKANADYWRAKIARNRDRDVKTLAAYSAMGWRALVVYECELKDKASLSARFTEALRTRRAASGKRK
jgi:DNA mismatch endonuclease (patch repair protein)